MKVTSFQNYQTLKIKYIRFTDPPKVIDVNNFIIYL